MNVVLRGKLLMVKRLLIILLILVAVIPLNVFATVSEDVIDETSDKFDRQIKEGDKAAVDAHSKINEKIERERETFEGFGLNDAKVNNDQAGEDFTNVSRNTYKFTMRLLTEIQRNSFPICLLGIIGGALIFFALGVRNIHRRRFGLMLMYGFLTIWAIAQIAPFIFIIMTK